MLALLKRAHGIELKSASSTIEEVVARQFVERLARERDITLPGGDMFAEGPAVEAGARSRRPAAKKPEPRKAGGADARAAATRQDREAGRAECRARRGSDIRRAVVRRRAAGCSRSRKSRLKRRTRCP